MARKRWNKYKYVDGWVVVWAAVKCKLNVANVFVVDWNGTMLWCCDDAAAAAGGTVVGVWMCARVCVCGGDGCVGDTTNACTMYRVMGVRLAGSLYVL